MAKAKENRSIAPSLPSEDPSVSYRRDGMSFSYSRAPLNAESLTVAIKKISDSVTRLLDSDPIGRKALIMLICEDTGYDKKTVNDILGSLATLRDKYCS